MVLDNARHVEFGVAQARRGHRRCGVIIERLGRPLGHQHGFDRDQVIDQFGRGNRIVEADGHAFSRFVDLKDADRTAGPAERLDDVGAGQRVG